MDRYLLAAAVLGVLAVLIFLVGSVSSASDARTVSYDSRTVRVNCKIVFEGNGAPVPGAMVYARGSTITDDAGKCSIDAEGGSFARLLVYVPGQPQKVVTVPLGKDENEINVVIPV